MNLKVSFNNCVTNNCLIFDCNKKICTAKYTYSTLSSGDPFPVVFQSKPRWTFPSDTWKSIIYLTKVNLGIIPYKQIAEERSQVLVNLSNINNLQRKAYLGKFNLIDYQPTGIFALSGNGESFPVILWKVLSIKERSTNTQVHIK